MWCAGCRFLLARAPAASRDSTLRAGDLGQLLAGIPGLQHCHRLSDVVEDERWTLHMPKCRDEHMTLSTPYAGSRSPATRAFLSHATAQDSAFTKIPPERRKSRGGAERPQSRSNSRMGRE